jgi:hypothetical protein
MIAVVNNPPNYPRNLTVQNFQKNRSIRSQHDWGLDNYRKNAVYLVVLGLS